MTAPILLIDDTRSFKPGFRDDAIVARSSEDGIEVLKNHAVFEEVWLDFVLAGMDDITNVLRWMRDYKREGNTLPEVKKFFYHSSGASGDSLVFMMLENAGYSPDIVERVWNRSEMFV